MFTSKRFDMYKFYERISILSLSISASNALEQGRRCVTDNKGLPIGPFCLETHRQILFSMKCFGLGVTSTDLSHSLNPLPLVSLRLKPKWCLSFIATAQGVKA